LDFITYVIGSVSLFIDDINRHTAVKHKYTITITVDELKKC